VKTAKVRFTPADRAFLAAMLHCPLPPSITDPDQIAQLDIRRHQRLGGILHEYQHAT
jgi:hypothetical protein